MSGCENDYVNVAGRSDQGSVHVGMLSARCWFTFL